MLSAKISQVFDNFQVIEIESSEQSYLPDAIQEAIDLVSQLDIDFQKGVVISHRGAIWLHSAIAHHFHVAKFVAHLDPRLGGAVIVQSHHPDYQLGQIIEIPKP